MNKLYYEIPNNEAAHKMKYATFYGGYIHESVQFLGEIKLGRGVIIEENCILKGNNFIGHNTIIRPNCVLGYGSEMRPNSWMAQDCWVGDHTVIYNYANLAMGTKVGNYVYFGVRSTTTNANDIVLHRERLFVPDPVTIEDGVRIATHVCINPGLTIGKNALVGAGSMLTKDVPSGEIWFGSPAQKRGLVDPNDVPQAWLDSTIETSIRNGK